MDLPQLHEDYIQSHPTFAGNRGLWLDTFFNQGTHAPAADIKGTIWHQPGSIIEAPVSEKNIYSTDCFGPASIPDNVRPIMVVAVATSFRDHGAGRSHLTDPGGQLLKKSLKTAGFDLSQVYYTTVMRFPRPINATSYKACWTRPLWQYFEEEFRRVNPKAILFMGAETVKLALGNKTNLQAVRGQKFEFGGVTAMAATSHLSFVSNTAGLPAFIKELALFRTMVVNPDAEALDGINYPDRDYRYLFDLDEIRTEIRAEIAKGKHPIAWDVETGNDTGHPEDDYITTFQWSSGPGTARVIPLYIEREEPQVPLTDKNGEYVEDEKGEVVYVGKFGGAGVDKKCRDDKVPDYEAIADLIREMMESKDLTWIGHNGREDLKWCAKTFGCNIRPIVREARFEDTMLMYHLLEKDAYSLKQLTLRFTDMGAYDAPMAAWVQENSGAGKLFPGNQESRFFFAYRDIAYQYLLPYACCDVDATYRIWGVLQDRLNEPDNARLKQIYYQIEIPVQLPIMDMEENGMPVDLERLQYLSTLYGGRREEMVEELREKIKWPDFNPNSSRQVSALLYKGPYKDWDKAEEVIPEGAMRLRRPVILTTGKYPKKWEIVQDKEEELYHSPSTSGETLVKYLATYDLTDEERGAVELLRMIAGIKNFYTNFLRPPVPTPLSSKPVYGKGLMGCIDSRNRVCTRISTTSETGRWKHSKPNLANLPKNKEKFAELVFGGYVEDADFHVPKIRTSFAGNDGWSIMEGDYSSAELFVMGYYSGDPAFIKVLKSGYDVHGYNAVNVFGLTCHPDEVAVKHPDKRSAVKAVVFGMAYGLSAAGLAERLTVDLNRLVTVDEASEIIDIFFSAYPVLKAFFERLKKSIDSYGYVETMYGRRRYFPGVALLGRDKLAAAYREGQNSPIQGTVADVLNLAAINLDIVRYETEVGRRIGWESCVGIHDALLVHFPTVHAPVMAKVLRYCMSDTVPLPGVGEKLAITAEYGHRWQEFTKIDVN